MRRKVKDAASLEAGHIVASRRTAAGRPGFLRGCTRWGALPHRAKRPVARASAPAVSLELAAERFAVEAKHLRGDRLVTLDRLHHVEDVTALGLLQRHEHRRIVGSYRDARSMSAPQLVGQVVEGDPLGAGKCDGALHAVLEFPYIARPVVGQEPL